MVGQRRPRPIQWTKGWFGAQLGATAWLCGSAYELFRADERAAGLMISVCFLVPNIVGLALWQRRAKIRLYRALQMLLAVAGVFAAFAMTILYYTKTSHLVGIRREAWYLMFLVFLVFPLMMIILHLLRNKFVQGAVFSEDAEKPSASGKDYDR